MKKIISVLVLLALLVAAFIDWPSIIFRKDPVCDFGKYSGLEAFEGYKPIDMTHIPEDAKGKVEIPTKQSRKKLTKGHMK